MLNPRALLKPPTIEKERYSQRRYQISLLHYSQLALIASTSFMSVVVYLIGRLGVIESLAGGFVVGGSLIGIILLRRHVVMASAVVFVFGLTAGTTLYMATNQGLDDPFMIVLALVMMEGILLLDKRWGYAFIGLIVTITGLLYLVVPNVTIDVWLLQAISFGLIGLLLRYGLNILDNSLLEVQNANEELRVLGQKQDELVRVRTRELALAVQVGNEIARLRDVQELLQKTVDAVRTNFGLYHTQIYLADAAGRTLSLQAGTGVVGRELVEQSHRLPIGPGSINGTAAARREAVIVTDTRQSPLFRPNPLLPETRAELAIPLIVSERVLGVLNLQSSEVNGLTESSISSFQLLGGQIAIAIENANLFTQVTRTQEELMAQARRLTKNNWQDYLTHLEADSQLSYSYSLEESMPTSSAASMTIHDAAYVAPIKVIGQTVGFIQVEGVGEGRWNPEDAELVQAVANQVAQQVENLRLLQESERYRAEAETVLRRLTKEGWQQYLHKTEDAPTLLSFDGHQIKAEPLPNSNRLMQAPLVVRGEAVGNLLVDGNRVDNQDRELVTAVANRLSTHIENLRLARQNELALAETQRRSEELALLNRVVTAVTTEKDLSASLNRIVHELSNILQVGRVGVALFNDDQTALSVAAESNTESTSIGVPIPVKGNTSTEEVLRTRQTVYIENAQSDPMTAAVHELFRQQGITSIAIMPLIVGADIIGTVGVAMVHGEAKLTQEKISLAETLIRQTGTAIQNLRLVEQSQKRAEELALLNNVAEAVASQLETKQLLETIFSQVSKLMAVDSFYVGLYDANTASMAYPYFYEANEVMAIPPTPLPETSLSYQVLTSGQPILLLEETEQEPVVFEFNENEFYEGHQAAPNIPTISCIFVPLRQGTQIVGVMSVQSYQAHAYSQEDVNLLLGVANYFTVGLQNAQLFDETQKRAEQLGALNQVAEAIASQLNISELIETIYGQIAKTIPTDAFQVGLYDPATNTIHYPLIVDRDERTVLPRRPLNPATKSYGVITTGVPLIYGEVDTSQIMTVVGEDQPVAPADLDGEITQSGMFVPLRQGGQTLGVLSVQSYQRNAYTQDDVNLLTGIANYFTVALQNASLFAQTQKRVSQLDAINHVAQSVGQQLDEEQLLETIAQQVQHVLPYDTFYVGLYQKGQNRMEFPIFYEDGAKLTAPAIQVTPHSYSRKVLNERQPLLILRDAADSPEQGVAIVPTGIDPQAVAARISLMFVPLIAGQEVIGVMAVQSKEQNAYSEDDIALLSGISSYFTVAWQNASLYAQTRKRAERERLVNEIAQQIQRTVTVEGALQTAAQALGRALQTAQTEVSLSN